MKKSSKKQYMKSQKVECPKCEHPVNHAEMKDYFGSTFIEDLNEELFRIQILQDSNMIE